jgi:hypothetical protein
MRKIWFSRNIVCNGILWIVGIAVQIGGWTNSGIAIFLLTIALIWTVVTIIYMKFHKTNLDKVKENPLHTKYVESENNVNTAKRDHELIKTLIKAQGAANELIRLNPNADANMKWSSYNRMVLVSAGDKYKVAIKKLKSEEPVYTTLMDSFLKGIALLDSCKMKNDILEFKPDLDKNSKEIINKVDEIINSVSR